MYQNILSIAIRSCAEFGIHDTCVIPPSSCTIQEQPMLILSLGYTMDELWVLPRDHIETGCLMFTDTVRGKACHPAMPQPISARTALIQTGYMSLSLRSPVFLT